MKKQLLSYIIGGFLLISMFSCKKNEQNNILQNTITNNQQNSRSSITPHLVLEKQNSTSGQNIYKFTSFGPNAYYVSLGVLQFNKSPIQTVLGITKNGANWYALSKFSSTQWRIYQFVTPGNCSLYTTINTSDVLSDLEWDASVNRFVLLNRSQSQVATLSISGSTAIAVNMFSYAINAPNANGLCIKNNQIYLLCSDQIGTSGNGYLVQCSYTPPYFTSNAYSNGLFTTTSTLVPWLPSFINDAGCFYDVNNNNFIVGGQCFYPQNENKNWSVTRPTSMGILPPNWTWAICNSGTPQGNISIIDFANF